MNYKKMFLPVLPFFLLAVLIAFPTKSSAKPAPKKLVLNYKEISLYEGESEILEVVSTKPKRASAKVVWKTKNRKIASVSARGKVLAKRAGKTKVIAVSKKNQAIRTIVNVTVKKRPAKKEKMCAAEGGIYFIGNGSRLSEAFRKSMEMDYEVIRTKAELKNFKQKLGKNGYKNINKSFLSQYADINFKAYSLVLVSCIFPRVTDYEIDSFLTEFDGQGKLCGKINVRQEKVLPVPGISEPTVMHPYILVLKLDKKEEAMIDYYKYSVRD